MNTRALAEYRPLKHADYIKLMQLLPRLKMEAERAQDAKGVKAIHETIRRVGRTAKAFIDAMASDDEEQMTKDCSPCRGTGKIDVGMVDDVDCHNCNGTGKIK